MPRIKISDLKQKKDDELKKQLDDLNKEKFNLRFQAANGQLSNTRRVREVRRGIAMIKTLLNKFNEKE